MLGLAIDGPAQPGPMAALCDVGFGNMMIYLGGAKRCPERHRRSGGNVIPSPTTKEQADTDEVAGPFLSVLKY